MPRKSRNERELKDIFKEAWEDIYDALNLVQASRQIAFLEKEMITEGYHGYEESFFESSREFNFRRLQKRAELYLIKPIVMPVLTILSLPFELAYHAYINFKPFEGTNFGPRKASKIAIAIDTNGKEKSVELEEKVANQETWGAYLYSKLPSKPTMSWLFNKNKEVQQQQNPIMLSQPTTVPVSLSTPTKEDRENSQNPRV